MPLINWEINLSMTWSANCIILSINIANQGPSFSLTDIKLYFQ